MTQDESLIQIVELSIAEAMRRGGAHVVCAPGCSHCCIGPFLVTAQDLARLRPHVTPEIAARAAEARARMKDGFPGDHKTGTVNAGSEEFEERHRWLPCPVLDLETGRCELHAHRPLACRLHGPALRLNGEMVRHCRLNYAGMGEDEIERLRVELTIPEDAPDNPLAYIAWAFTKQPDG